MSVGGVLVRRSNAAVVEPHLSMDELGKAPPELAQFSPEFRCSAGFRLHLHIPSDENQPVSLREVRQCGQETVHFEVQDFPRVVGVVPIAVLADMFHAQCGIVRRLNVEDPGRAFQRMRRDFQGRAIASSHRRLNLRQLFGAILQKHHREFPAEFGIAGKGIVGGVIGTGRRCIGTHQWLRIRGVEGRTRFHSVGGILDLEGPAVPDRHDRATHGTCVQNTIKWGA